MATGANLQPARDNRTSALPPSVDLDTGAAKMWESVSRLGDQLYDAQKPELARLAQQRGQEDAAAVLSGEAEAPKRGLLSFGQMDAARTSAFEESYRAGRASDWDAIEQQARIQHSHDVEAYDRAIAQARSEFIQKSEPDFAVDLETYANRRIAAGRADIAQNVQGVQLREAAVEIGTRQASLSTRLIDMLREGRAQTIDYEILRDERDQLIRSRLDNPAIVYTQAEADKDERDFVVGAKAAVYTNHAVTTLREDGPTAALGSLQEILRDPELDGAERQAAFESARAAINQEINNARDQQMIAQQARTQAEQAMQRRIEDDAAAIEIGAQPTGLTEAEVMAALGPSGVQDWRRKQAEASERNRLTGTLVGLPQDEAIRRAMAALPGAQGSVVDLNDPLKTPTDFYALAAAVRMVETGTNPARVSEAGAIGAMQLLPETARQMAALEGVPYDQSRLLNDPAYNERLGKRYLTQLLDKYAGNQMLAVSAYHAGPALIDAWLQPPGTITNVRLGGRTVQARGRGDPRTGEISTAAWLDSIGEGNPRSAAYPRKVAEALSGGRASAEWQRTQAEAMVTNARQGFASDPLNFANQHRLSALPPLSVDGVFQGGEGAARWRQALQARANAGQALASQNGVPLRYLTNGEAAAYRDRIERDPASAIVLARTATAAIGGRGARNLLAEVGQGSQASTAIHIADLAASGGDNRFADAAARGLTLKAAGQTLDTGRRDEVTAEINRWRGLLSSTPSLLAAVQNTATAAALADEVNGVVRPADYYPQAALGRTTYGRQRYGGAAEVNGANVILPRWLGADQFDEALEVLADQWASSGQGPAYAGGQPMPASIASRLRPVLQPSGNYRLQDDQGRIASRPDGRPFEVDMDAARILIQQRLGLEAVRPD